MYREKPHLLFIRYALPQMIGLLLNSAYLIVNGIFIGNRLGRDAMAAAAISVPVGEILIALSLAISVGAGVVISSSFGRGEAERANQAFGLSLLLAGLASLLVAVFGNIFLSPLATALGATPDIHGEATTYLWYLVTGAPLLVFSFAFSSYVRVDNRPRLAMAALAVGSAANILLDYVFMYPLDMGLAGAGLATALGPLFSIAIMLPHFLRRRGLLRFAVPRLSRKLCLSILFLGLPAFVMEFSIGIVTLFYNLAVVLNGFGEIGLAAYLAIGYLALIILTVFLGIGQGVQPLISYFHGKGDHGKIRELTAFLFKAIAVLGIAMYAGVLLFSLPFIAVFTPSDAELVAFTHDKASVYFSGFVFAGANILIITFLQSLHKAGAALVVSLLRSVVFVPAFLFGLPPFFGGDSIWPALSLAEFAAFMAAAVIYRRALKAPNAVEPPKPCEVATPE